MPGLAASVLLLASAVQGAATPDVRAPEAAGVPGSSLETAIPVESVADEYRYLRDRGLMLVSQALVHGRKGRAYDVMKVRDRATDVQRDIWFDISDIYGINDR